jgi:hypothetical protein
MFTPVTKDTLVLENGWAKITVPLENPVLKECIERTKRGVHEKLLTNIAYFMGSVFQSAALERYRLKAEYAARGKEWHPIDLGPKLDPPVSIFESYAYTSCGSIAYLAAFLAAQAGVEGCGILSGKLIIENSGRGDGGHTVAIFPALPRCGYPEGLVYEATEYGDGLGDKFSPKLTALGKGEYEQIVQGKIEEIQAGKYRFLIRKPKIEKEEQLPEL